MIRTNNSFVSLNWQSRRQNQKFFRSLRSQIIISGTPTLKSTVQPLHIGPTLSIDVIKESHYGGSGRDDGYRCLTLTAHSMIWGILWASPIHQNKHYLPQKFSILKPQNSPKCSFSTSKIQKFSAGRGPHPPRRLRRLGARLWRRDLAPLLSN